MLNIFIFTLVIGCFFSFLTCFLTKNLGLVDVPDRLRKKHEGDIPLGGGIAIALTIFITFLIFDPLSDFITILCLSSLILLILGVIDDLKPLPISIRLIVQIIASWAVIIFTDVYLKDFGDLFGIGILHLGELGIPLTIFMVVGMSNAFNMLDGMDGLVCIVSIIAFSSLAVIGYLDNNLSLWNVVIIASLISFLGFNLGLFGQRWKMFLGDSGAYVIGHFIAWSLVYMSQGVERSILPVSALWLVCIPLIDALSTFLIRLKARKPIFSGDRNHIHFAFLDRGISENRVLILIIIFSIVGSSIAIFSSRINSFPESYFFYGFLTLWVFYLLLIKYPLSEK